ncbi:hypothetical protein QBC37DRAFT_415720 [Rhypophila decipiens]|uniref:Uncharacterized protein n=1 Tax=Rhypophila decipiens TaxID=261697 RepID=A0AAN7BAM3_9PEZI|nr:hypothetical protein QBC37DRAFT_415720 [Rhypophila decipiens]
MSSISESSDSSASHVTNGAMAETTLPGKGHKFPLLIEPLPTLFQIKTSRHSNSTPPPDDIPVTQAQLVSGAGGLFPSLPPSRASSLTMGSEPPTTPVRGSHADGSHSNIMFGEHDDLSTPVAQRNHTPDNRELLIPPRIPWTPPSSTPRCRSRKRRTSSPLFSPRPPKLARFQRWDEHDQPVSQQVEDEGYCDEESQVQQTAAAFRNAQGLAFVLAGTATNAEFQPTVATSSGRFHVFGGSLLGTENANEENDSSRSHDNNSHLVLPSEDNSISGTSSSVHCHYGQDELMVQVEWFTEDEIEAQLSELLASYRAVYLVSLSDEDTDEIDENKQDMIITPAQDGPVKDKRKADSALEIFKLMAHGRLNWAELEMVLQEEEEDVLDLFMTWVQDMLVPRQTQSKTFLDTRECVGYLKKLTVPSRSGSDRDEINALPFIRKIRLWSNGCLDRFLYGLPGIRGVNASSLSLDGAVEWEFNQIYCGLGEKEVAELVTAWDDFIIHDE